jgi:Pre-mRNA splicing Prp18-interacting factor
MMAKGKMNYEAKRDRWNGYDPQAFKQVIEEWNEVNEVQS